MMKVFLEANLLPKEKIKLLEGDCATFKTTSGWSDRKYYVLVNNITPGTIVRITARKQQKYLCQSVGCIARNEREQKFIEFV
ncbi:MAG: hypothetical protein V9E96_21885 [Chitinophagaceae bacterium]